VQRRPHTDRTASVRRYRNGFAHGRWRVREAGLSVDVAFVRGQPHGRWRFRSEWDGGALTITGRYHRGEKQGRWISVHERAGEPTIRRTGLYRGGKEHGTWTERSGGKVTGRVHFVDGKPVEGDTSWAFTEFQFKVEGWPAPTEGWD
jgi:hypothetical protein